MKELKRGIVPFLLVMLVAFVMTDFGDGEIKYIMANYESLPVQQRNFIKENGPGGTGMFQYDGSSYAFIATEPDEKVDVLFVGKAEDGVGNEVRYKVVKNDGADDIKIIDGRMGRFALYLLRLEKVVPTPFGFNNVNL
ncbi:hypothetical protein [Bacillus sp. ISL-55]|uniref:hypothetical protein n=1 Tax=Bacillus sp. ISL-55 TaxID=2819134 RepID=UPI001BE5DE12|nr:hypothetical protein [Bacillus sp. ISL-55]MBT2695733.1 hypothetical protein [Bacillus sp. ISL-55]